MSTLLWSIDNLDNFILSPLQILISVQFLGKKQLIAV